MVVATKPAVVTAPPATVETKVTAAKKPAVKTATAKITAPAAGFKERVGKKFLGGCPICGWVVYKGEDHKINGKTEWYHGHCWIKHQANEAAKADAEKQAKANAEKVRLAKAAEAEKAKATT